MRPQTATVRARALLGAGTGSRSGGGGDAGEARRRSPGGGGAQGAGRDRRGGANASWRLREGAGEGAEEQAPTLPEIASRIGHVVSAASGHAQSYYPINPHGALPPPARAKRTRDHAYCDDRRRLCRPGVRRLLRRVRHRRGLRRQGRRARSPRCSEGRMPIYEPGLDELVAENVAAGRLAFTADLADAVRRRRGGVHRRRHADPARRRPRRPDLRLSPPPSRSPARSPATP